MVRWIVVEGYAGKLVEAEEYAAKLVDVEAYAGKLVVGLESQPV